MGDAAIEQFRVDATNEAAEFEPLETILKSSAIKKRWSFTDSGDEWYHHWLIVLDEHDQLWGMSMGYSE